VVTAYAYDTAGRVTGVTAASGTSDALTFTTAYDALDRTTKTTRPGNRVATFEYDALGQVTKTSDGVGTALARFSSMGYDLAGEGLVFSGGPLTGFVPRISRLPPSVLPTCTRRLIALPFSTV